MRRGFIDPRCFNHNEFLVCGRGWRARLSGQNRVGRVSPESFVVPEKWGGTKAAGRARSGGDKRNSTGSILGYHSVLQVEAFEWNVTACAVGADVFEIAVGDPVVDYDAAGAIVQHQLEGSLPQSPVFGRRANRGSGVTHGRIPFCRVVIRWIGSGRDRGHFRLLEPLGIGLIVRVKRVSAEAEIKRIKVTAAGEKRQEWFEEADPGSRR